MTRSIPAREVAAVPLGRVLRGEDGAVGEIGRGRASIVTTAAGQLVERGGGEAQVGLARRALVARLDVEKPRHGLGDAYEAAPVVVHHEAGRAEPRADRRRSGRSRLGVSSLLVGPIDRGGDARRGRALGSSGPSPRPPATL